MERGTDRERKRVRERWETLERQRRAATRRLGALALAGSGLVSLLLGIADRVCFNTARGGLADCASMVRPPFGSLFLLFGAVALAVGLWRYRRA